MKKKVGILYDNISGNIGDLAVGISVKNMLSEFGVHFEELVPGRFNPKDYNLIIVGGGYLLRPSPDFFYDKFRVTGPYILNSCGIVGNPTDLDYLENYAYISVRSKGDKRKISYLKNEVNVVPCTAMLLNDLHDLDIKICHPNIGVNLGPGLIDDPKSLVRYLSKLPFYIYLLPITHYNHDFKHLARLRGQLKNCTLLPVLKPQEIFTVIGKFDYFISASLHGAIFSYVHNVPFTLAELDEKMTFFMKERNIDKYLFRNFVGLKAAIDKLIDDKPDYMESLNKDFQVLENHKNKIKELLPTKESVFIDNDLSNNQVDLKYLKSNLQGCNIQIQYLRQQVKDMENQLFSEAKAIDGQTYFYESSSIKKELDSIHNSHGWKLLMRYYRLLDTIFPLGSRRRLYAKKLRTAVKRAVKLRRKT